MLAFVNIENVRTGRQEAKSSNKRDAVGCKGTTWNVIPNISMCRESWYETLTLK